MKPIQLNDNYKLESNDNCFILRRKSGKKNTRWDIIGYYPYLRSAIEAFVTRVMLDTNEDAVKEARKTIEELKNMEKEIKEVFGE